MSEAFIYAMRQLFQVRDELFTNELGRRDVLALASCCQETLRLVRPHVERRYVFSISRWVDRRIVVYNPRAILIDLRLDADAARANCNERALQVLDWFPRAEHVILAGEFNAAIDHLPASLTHLGLSNRFNQPIDRLPLGLAHLTLGNFFDHPVDHLPATLTHLALGVTFREPVDHLPASLTHLRLGCLFNQPIDHLPPGLTHLTLGAHFDQPVEHLPTGLTHLTLGIDFNHLIERLPAGLKHLTLGYHFDRSVDYLPASLTHLELGVRFNQPIDRLPATLTHLVLGHYFGQSMASLPDSLVLLRGPRRLLDPPLVSSLVPRVLDFSLERWRDIVVFRLLAKTEAKSLGIKRLSEPDDGGEPSSKRR
jgi:hypothetical protein